MKKELTNITIETFLFNNDSSIFIKDEDITIKINKIFKIIESCLTADQLENAFKLGQEMLKGLLYKYNTTKLQYNCQKDTYIEKTIISINDMHNLIKDYYYERKFSILMKNLI